MSLPLTNLVKVLRDAGVAAVGEKYTRGPYAGQSWKTVCVPGSFQFKHILWHHDASPTGSSPGALDWVKYMEIAPAGQVWVCHGCGVGHAEAGYSAGEPVWHVISAGRANHAGVGGDWSSPWGVPKDAMNGYSLGIETDHGYGESWKPAHKQAQLASLRRGTAAIIAAYGLAGDALLFHKTWTNGEVDGYGRFPSYGRKNDIDGLDLLAERETVADLVAELTGVPRPKPQPEPAPSRPLVALSDVKPGARNASVRRVQEALRAAGFAELNPGGATGFYGKETEAMVCDFEASIGIPSPNGRLSMRSLRRLGKLAGFEVTR